MKTFSKIESLSYGWKRFKERPLFLIGLFVITTVISIITGMVADKASGWGVGVLVNAIDFSVQIMIGMGITLILLRAYDNVDTDYTDLLEPLHLFWRYLAMTILVVVVVVIGFLLFIIPGIIAAIALSFTTYLVIDRNLGPVAAMKESLQITQGHRWNLFIFGLSMFFLNLLGALFFGIGLLVTIPVSALATVHVYRWLLDPPDERGIEVTAFAKMMSAFVLVVMIISFVVVVALLSKNLINGNPQVRDEWRKADLVDIKLGAALFFDSKGIFPTTLQQMVPEYLDKVPVDPSTGEVYSYIMYADGTDYEVCTTLETMKVSSGSYCEFGLELGSSN